MIQDGDKVRLPGWDRYVTLVMHKEIGGQIHATVQDGDQVRVEQFSIPDWKSVVALRHDGSAGSEQVLAGLWTEWMGAAAATVDGAAMVSTSLTPYPHQHQAVYQRMLPQPNCPSCSVTNLAPARPS